mgnify:CR=1 FL=1
MLVIDGNIPRINLKQFPAGDLQGSIDDALNIADILILIDEEKTDKKIVEKIKNYKKGPLIEKFEKFIRFLEKK